MKKIRILALILMAVFCFAACDGIGVTDCPECGHFNGIDDKFCSACGVELTEDGDDVTSGAVPGQLGVKAYHANGKSGIPAEVADWTPFSNDRVFDDVKWEPGLMQARHVKILNSGSVVLKYRMNIKPDGALSELSNVIDVYCIDPAARITSIEDLTEEQRLGTLAELMSGYAALKGGVLEVGESDTVTLVLLMQVTAGSEYIDVPLGAELDIRIIATQYSSESDSFGTEYDMSSIPQA